MKAALATPELSALYALDSFEAKEWVAEARLRDLFVQGTKEIWDKLYAMIEAVSAETGVPGRSAGTYVDLNDTRRMIGGTLHFGYSSEVGYDHKNDFWTD